MVVDTKKKVFDFFKLYNQIHYEKNEIIIHPEDRLRNAIYIESGYVREYTVSPDGVELTLHIYGPKSFFPMTTIIGGVPVRYYYEALTSIEGYTAPKDDLYSFLEREPQALMDLTTRLLQGLDKLSMRVEFLVFSKAHTKLISMLLYLSRHFGHQTGNSVQINQPFTHRDIASLAGITRETVSREWEKLQKRNLITYDHHLINIPDIRKLHEEMEFPE